ncbi:LysR family transcriptional regulator [Leisingera sp.]|uniref:LysR family transcriptional regulator n=1 Tax=Leisingera sp. TaxID=1879318 RepID=UPI002B2702BD|nr:LysR family transcriptional regulator [Leisingera sp.]
MIKTNGQTRSLRRLLTHLRGLRAFEAVAHYQSFTLAAEELAVSQGAVSHQIKQLEERFGTRLFKRTRHGVLLEPEGELLKEVCGRGFDEIGETLSLISQRRETQLLRVRSGPFFAMKVIAPRISEFLSANPGLQLHLSNLEPDSASLGSEDVLIKYCVQPPANSVSVEILKEKLVPICNPSLTAEGKAYDEIIADTGIARLHYRDMSDWDDWLKLYGGNGRTATQNLIFDDQHTILEAIRSGQGIGVADRSLVREDVTRGRIVILSENYLRPETSYKFIFMQERAGSNSSIRLFRDWLENEVTKLQDF